nr:unnamed protein product [Spirometra erinaceieuropaei]
MFGIDDPDLLSVQNCPQDDDLVNLQFGIQLETVKIPHGVLQPDKGLAGFGEPAGTSSSVLMMLKSVLPKTTFDAPSPSTITTNAPISSDMDSTNTCLHCDNAFTMHIGLVSHKRIHLTETAEPLPGAPAYTRHIRLHCAHCTQTFIHRMGLLDHNHTYRSGIHCSPDTSSTPWTTIMPSPIHKPALSAANPSGSITTGAASDTPNVFCLHYPATHPTHRPGWSPVNLSQGA